MTFSKLGTRFVAWIGSLDIEVLTEQEMLSQVGFALALALLTNQGRWEPGVVLLWIVSVPLPIGSG